MQVPGTNVGISASQQVSWLLSRHGELVQDPSHTEAVHGGLTTQGSTDGTMSSPGFFFFLEATRDIDTLLSTSWGKGRKAARPWFYFPARAPAGRECTPSPQK